jgi:hypothetical protein
MRFIVAIFSIPFRNFSSILLLPNPKDWLDALGRVFHALFGPQIPHFLIITGVCIFLIVSALLGIWGGLYVASEIKKLFIEHFRPKFYAPEQMVYAEQRRRFADHIEGEMRRLNMLEQWNDYKFAELEAEVETEGYRKGLLSSVFGYSGIRREKGLSAALRRSAEDLVIVEGAPGAGKSIALRHVCQIMAQRAMRSKHISSLIPVYVNLKLIDIQSRRKVTKQDIKAFVLQSINRVNDRDIDSFLDEYFDKGMREGSWLFLFDSFDEIPAILSSVEADEVIGSYAEAIADFLGGMNTCRGVIASREFRGPRRLPWPRFRILPLSKPRQINLINKLSMPSEIEQQVRADLFSANAEIREMSTNPMFLALLCEHVSSGNAFPENAHALFERYVVSRLERDSDRIYRRYQIHPATLRLVAEAVAFCMSADDHLGLNPTRDALSIALTRHNFDIRVPLAKSLDALEYLKLARAEQQQLPGESASFTFAHRRFQEYFATCALLEDSTRVEPERLMLDGNWREAAVVLFQTQSLTTLEPILKVAEEFLSQAIQSLSTSTSFQWPSGAWHLLSLLQDGFAGKREALPKQIKDEAGSILSAAVDSKSRLDQKWALQVAGVASEDVLLNLIREAMASSSNWLKEVAYRQVARLPEIPEDIRKWIRHSLVFSATRGDLLSDRFSVVAFLRRLTNPEQYLSAARLLIWAPFIDALCLVIAAVLLNRISALTSRRIYTAVIVNSALLLSAWLMFWLPPQRLLSAMFRGAQATKFFQLTWGCTIRFIAPLGFLIAMLTKNPTAHFFLVTRSGNIFAIVVLILLWAPGALVSAWFGCFTRPTLWPLQMLSPCMMLCLNPILRIHEIARWMKREKYALWPALLGVLLGGAVLYALLHLHISPVVIGGLFTLILGLPFVYVASVTLKDYLQWRSISRLSPGTVSAQHCAQLLAALNTQFFVRAFLQRARTQELLPVGNRETLNLLLAIADAMPIPDEADSAILAARKVVRRGGSQTADELWRLIEHNRMADVGTHTDVTAASC